MTILLGLYTAFVSILVIVAVQLVITIIIMTRLGRLQRDFNQLVSEKKDPIVVPSTEEAPNENAPKEPLITVTEKPSEGISQKDETKEAKGTQGTKEPEPQKSSKEKVLEAIQEKKKKKKKDVQKACKELLPYFTKYANEDYTQDLSSKSYYRLIDLRNQPDTRVVTIGDIHSDFNSLAAVLLKLSISDYDYFEKAIFIFLGDYLDRGSTLFEPLMLLKSLKEIMGDRLIMLKGNHESVRYDADKKKITTNVTPNQSCECLNTYCGKENKFLQQFAYFYSKLPIYVYLKTKEKNILLTHGAIPRDTSQESIHFDENSGAIIFDNSVPVTNRLQMRNIIFKDMIWGDPKDCDMKIQTEGRFEFGRLQFDNFAQRNHIDMLFRSHEEATRGYCSFFDNKVFTIFSTGGAENDQTGYPAVEPAFAIIQNERFVIENSYIYRLQLDGSPIVLNLFNKQKYTDKQQEGLKLGDEFKCSKEQGNIIRSVFKHIEASFNSD